MTSRSLEQAHQQQAYRIRLDWGTSGASAVARNTDIAVVVDVLSFTTTLSVALDVGTEVLPYRWKDDSALVYARKHDALLAVSRDMAGPGDISLSAQTIRTSPPTSRLVLPSPNGSTISWHLATIAPTVLGASLRNARTVATWITNHAKPQESTITLVAAGEQWPDGTLRPAIEDLWGAGAVLVALHEQGWTGFSPEADVARYAYAAVASDIHGQLRACASGRELIEDGYAADVDIAAEIDQSCSVPVLHGNRFVQAAQT